jgi:hypothetical protein
MLNWYKTHSAIALCVVMAFAESSAHAAPSAGSMAFDLAPGHPLPTDDGVGNGTAYSWYYQQIPVAFEFYDSNGYVNFQGTASSTNGHCLVLSNAAPGNYPDGPPYAIEIQANVHGTSRGVAYFAPGGYSTLSIWIQNTGSGLYWDLQLTPYDMYGGYDPISVGYVNLTRLEVNQTQCTTQNTANPDSSTAPWVSFVGTNSSYTVHAGVYGNF